MGALYTNNPKKSSNITATLFRPDYTCYADAGSAAADKQQCHPQHSVTVFACLGGRRFIRFGQFFDYRINL